MIEFIRPWWLLAMLPALAWVVWLARTSHSGLAPARLWTSCALRVLLVVALVCALAGMRLKWERDDLAVVFLLDHSRSVPVEYRERDEAFVRHASAARDSRRQAAGVIVFGRTSAVDQPVSDQFAAASTASNIESDATDLGRAMRLAMASIPEGYAGRIVILSDGEETRPGLQEEAERAAAEGVELWARPIRLDRRMDLLVRKVMVPMEVFLSQPFEVAVQYELFGLPPDREIGGQLYLYRNNQLLGMVDADFHGGIGVVRVGQRIRSPEEAPSEGPGMYEYTATLVLPGDETAENNRGFAYTNVRGEPKILIVDSEPAEVAAFAAVLERAGVGQVVVREPSAMPQNVPQWLEFDAVILSDLPAMSMSEAQMASLRDYVRAHGGGLVMAGGPSSFGAGNWYDTPVEEALPVFMDIRKKVGRATTAFVIVIDYSGSMRMTVPTGETKLQLANEGAIAAIANLGPGDYVSVIYVDENPSVAVPLIRVPDGSRDRLYDTIRSTQGGGGGIYCHTALTAAYREMGRARTSVRHVILFSDTSDSEQQEGCIDMVREFASRGVTCSVVGMGLDSDMDSAFLRDLAQAGGGRWWPTADPTQLPEVFSQEAVLAARTAVREEDFVPRIAGPGEIIEGVAWDSAPPLHGYVATTLKTLGEELLRAMEEDPLLARWTFGLGRSVAFTSDVKNRWAANWLDWDGYGAFWPQAVRWVVRRESASTLRSDVVLRGDEGTVSVDAFDEEGRPRNFLDLTAHVSTPDGEVMQLPLRQVGAGRYEAQFAGGAAGAYVATIADQDGNLQGTAGTAMMYLAEYAPSGQGPERLARAAELTGGRVDMEPETVFAPPAHRAKRLVDMVNILLASALAALLLDVTMRRMAVFEGIAALLHGMRREKEEAAQEAQPASAPVPIRTVTMRESSYEPESKAAPSPAPGEAPKPLPQAGAAGMLERLLKAKQKKDKYL